MTTPRVSIVLSTYNRPEALRLAIESVRAQSWEDWELLVVGDACSDSTEGVVSGFNDPRIGYLNLARNFGEQSGPNNVGVARTRGKIVAFLNHDDLWLPDHLRSCLEALEATGASMVFPLTAVMLPASDDELRDELWLTYIHGIGRNGRFDPVGTFAPASSWLFQREAIERVGLWRPARECVTESSRDFLFRAWRAGLDMRALPWISLLAFHSGLRDAEYTTPGAREQEYFWRKMRDFESLRRQLLARASNAGNVPRGRLIRGSLMLLAHLGVSPVVLEYRARGLRSGQLIEELRRKKGLPRLPPAAMNLDDVRVREIGQSAEYRLGTRVSFRGRGTAAEHQTRGWSRPESWGTWTDGSEAGLTFRLNEPPCGDVILEAEAKAYVDDRWPVQRVEIRIGGTGLAEWSFDVKRNLGSRTVRIPATLCEGNSLEISFRMPDARSPASLGHGSDSRRLGVALTWLRLASAPV